MSVRRAQRGAPADVRAADGRKTGRRGQATRDKLLRCVAKLLEKTSYRELSVIDIARCAGTSPATFYQYFPDIEEAVLVLARALTEDAHRLTELIDEDAWKRNGARAAAALADGFFDLWERHRAVLRVVDLATAEGDLRFQNIRTHMLNEVTVCLRDVIAGFKRQGKHPRSLDPMAHAAALVSLLAHVAAHRYGYEFWGIRINDVRTSVVQLLSAGVTGPRA
jgi:AcrR family transcriptional regulator